MNFINENLKNRIFGLDVLRAAAILFVVFAHGKRIISPFVSNEILNKFSQSGVPMFFVLSGFLIGRILIKIYFKESDLNWKDIWGFWIRRWWRTVPPYFIVLTILILFKVLILGQSVKIIYLKYYLFIQNLWYKHPPFYPVSWSLSVEEWFYISFPLMLFILAIVFKQRSRPAFLFSVACFFLISFAYRTYITLDAINFGINIRQIYGIELRKVVLSRFDNIMLGVVAAYLFYFHNSFWNKSKWPFLILGSLIFLSHKNIPWSTYPMLYGIFSLSVTAIATFLLLPFLNGIKTGKGLLAKLIVLISTSSYSMYLIHTTIRDVLLYFLPHKTPFWAFFTYGMYWLASIIISAFVYRIMEHPILAFRDKLYQKQSI